jgi:tetratricopeptide (TPR) repeat protein
MKIKSILLTILAIVSFSTFAQKDELKTLKKLYSKDKLSLNDVQEYKTAVTKLKAVATDESDKVYADFYKSMTPILEVQALGKNVSPVQLQKIFSPSALLELATGLNATLDYENKVGKKIYTDDIKETIKSFKPQFVNVAIDYSNSKKYKEAGDVLYNTYLLDKSDAEKLFYAASFMVSAQDYDKALEYYEELKKINYSGEGTSYLAVNKATNQEESFATDKEREIYVKAGTHEKPRNEAIPSKKGEIYKNIALILVDKGQVEEAKKAVADARKQNPDDDGLILVEADLYLKVNDFETYKKLVNEALVKDPNNANLVFNLGVISANANKIAESEKYYLKAIELKPDYFDAYLNLSEVKLRADEKFVEEMNKLGVTEKDNKRYEVLKAEREKNFKSVLPYLEKAVELKPENEPALKTLLSVYNALEMTAKYKALKAKINN